MEKKYNIGTDKITQAMLREIAIHYQAQLNQYLREQQLQYNRKTLDIEDSDMDLSQAQSEIRRIMEKR